MGKTRELWPYFAYGSNLLVARLQARTPSAKLWDKVLLPGHDLRFHKIGDDGSGKCDAFFTGEPDHAVWGVIYHLGLEEKATLDAIEGVGHGYELKQVTLAHPSGKLKAWTYVVQSSFIDAGMTPFDWYHSFVLAGARQHDFPEAYLTKIEAIQSRRDTHSQRRSTHLKMLVKNARF